VVVDNVDVERHRSLKLIEEIPGLRNRSIGVLTKCDLKQQTSDQWVWHLWISESYVRFRLKTAVLIIYAEVDDKAITERVTNGLPT
jgi:hypothetical protein